MVKMMLKIGKKGQTCHFNPRSKLGNDSFKRALDIVGQDSGACCPTDRRNSPVSPFNWEQMHDSLTYQTEAEQKRALGIMYASRNTLK